jgi:hypothetical protein
MSDNGKKPPLSPDGKRVKGRIGDAAFWIVPWSDLKISQFIKDLWNRIADMP